MPLPVDARPVVGFDGDALVVLNQEVSEETLDVAVTIRSYRIDTWGCRWQRFRTAR